MSAPTDWMATYPGPADLAAFVLEQIAKDEAATGGEFDYKRRIVEDHSALGGFRPSASWHDDDNQCSTCAFLVSGIVTDAEGYEVLATPTLKRRAFPCLTLRNLAAPYADHPAFRDDWKTE